MRGGKQKFQKRGQAGSTGECLKKRKLGPPYELWSWTSMFNDTTFREILLPSLP